MTTQDNNEHSTTAETLALLAVLWGWLVTAMWVLYTLGKLLQSSPGGILGTLLLLLIVVLIATAPLREPQ